MALPHRQTGNADESEILNGDFDRFMTEVLNEFQIPGASIAVVHGDRIESKGYGVRYINGPPVTSGTLFNVASMSKSFTAGAVGLLVDDKENFPQVTWETPISTLMRDNFVLPDAYANDHANAVDLLSHRTGFFGHNAADRSPRAKVPDTPQSMTRKLRHIRMNKPFRTEFQYNNQMYVGASYLVEYLTKTPFYTFLKSRFWDPLAMTNTYGGQDLPGGPRIPQNKLTSWSDQHNIALPHFYSKDREEYKILAYPSEPEGQGAGNIASTAPDYAKWIQSMMHHTNALIPETIMELTKPRIMSSDNEKHKGDRREPLHSPQFYCMGWNAEYYRGHKCIDHSGGINGFTSIMRYLPEQKFGVVLFGNSGGMSDASEVISWKLIDDFFGVPVEEQMDWVKRMKADDEEDDDDEKKPFPNRPDPPLPLPLPLEKFTGKFTHPAFGDYDFRLTGDGKELIADATDRTFGFWMKLEHVSSFYFLAKMEDAEEDDTTTIEAEFRVGADGEVKELGIDFENADGDYDPDREMIWFKKVSD